MTEECITPLRWRMIEPFRVEDPARLHPHGYETDKIPRPIAGQATNEDLRRFQLHLAENLPGQIPHLNPFVIVPFHATASIALSTSAGAP